MSARHNSRDITALLAAERIAGKVEGYSEAIKALLPMVERMQTLRAALDEQLGGLIDDLGRWKAHQEAKAKQEARIN